jgi:ABC-type phosphate/phosphonate transport system substrate-binding protein
MAGMLMCHGIFAAEYRVGIRAKSGIDHAISQWQATIDTLNQQIPEHRFILTPILKLEEVTAAAGRGDIEFVLTNPSSYIEIESLHGAKALLTLNNKRAGRGQDRFGTVIFTHAKHTDIIDLKDLKGKTVMGVSEPAFGGWRVAWLEFLRQGLDPYRDFKQLLFAEDRIQPTVVYAVRDGKADAGVVRTDQLERMEAAGLIDMRFFRILNNQDIKDFPFFLSTPLYPEWPFAVMPGVPDNVTQKVKAALLAINADSEAANNGEYVGWLPPLDYGPVRELMQRLQVGPDAE